MEIRSLIRKILVLNIVVLCASCSSIPPETVEGKEWRVNDSGDWGEHVTQEITIYENKPKHTLPKDLGKK